MLLILAFWTFACRYFKFIPQCAKQKVWGTWHELREMSFFICWLKGQIKEMVYKSADQYQVLGSSPGCLFTPDQLALSLRNVCRYLKILVQDPFSLAAWSGCPYFTAEGMSGKGNALWSGGKGLRPELLTSFCLIHCLCLGSHFPLWKVRQLNWVMFKDWS